MPQHSTHHMTRAELVALRSEWQAVADAAWSDYGGTNLRDRDVWEGEHRWVEATDAVATINERLQDH